MSSKICLKEGRLEATGSKHFPMISKQNFEADDEGEGNLIFLPEVLSFKFYFGIEPKNM